MIEKERKLVLEQLVEYVNEKLTKNETIKLNFICTHNSRRSHLAQIWAQIAAWENGLSNIHCYSGGTEATALYPMIADTLTKQGLELIKLSEESNPVYGIKYHQDFPPIIAFSKAFDHPYNPSSAFAAIMTCSDADENCPLIVGAERRIAITYEDPKVSDGTSQQSSLYLERSKQIKAEMDYVFKSVRSKL